MSVAALPPDTAGRASARDRGASAGLLLRAEALRFVRHRVNLAVGAVVFALLAASALDAGRAAGEHRAAVAAAQAAWLQRLDALARDAATPRTPVEAPAHATAAFELGRTEAPPAPRPALGGLALAVRHFGAVPANVRVSAESRYVDSRRTEPIVNPLLASVGRPDFAVVVALLLPLLVVAWSYGLVQEARELGTWRLVRAQCRRPWAVLGWALVLRGVAALVVVAAASGLAFVLDPGATLAAYATWLLAVAACTAIWCALAALANLLPLSSSGAAVSLLGAWLLTSFAAPAAVQAAARAVEPLPSRLASVVEVRRLQAATEAREQALVAAWYREHPAHRPATIDSHTFPVTFFVRYLEQDRLGLDAQRRFDAVRAAQAAVAERLAGLTPGPALVLVADRLAGVDAASQYRYLRAVDAFEAEWRRALAPAVMSYRGLREEDMRAVRDLEFRPGPAPAHGKPTAVLLALAATAALLLGGALLQRRAAAAG